MLKSQSDGPADRHPVPPPRRPCSAPRPRTPTPNPRKQLSPAAGRKNPSFLVLRATMDEGAHHAGAATTCGGQQRTQSGQRRLCLESSQPHQPPPRINKHGPGGTLTTGLWPRPQRKMGPCQAGDPNAAHHQPPRANADVSGSAGYRDSQNRSPTCRICREVRDGRCGDGRRGRTMRRKGGHHPSRPSEATRGLWGGFFLLFRVPLLHVHAPAQS